MNKLSEFFSVGINWFKYDSNMIKILKGIKNGLKILFTNSPADIFRIFKVTKNKGKQLIDMAMNLNKAKEISPIWEIVKAIPTQ